MEPCDCSDLRDWASFALLLFELNLVVYADYAGSKSSGDAIKKLQEASASKIGVLRDGSWTQSVPMIQTQVQSPSTMSFTIGDDLQALALGIDVERSVLELYRQASLAAKDREVKKAYEFLLRDKSRHYRRLRDQWKTLAGVPFDESSSRIPVRVPGEPATG